jgi:EAL domain-containing protein (putative c-di-GMP-specific phosphodiesterase class I)
LNADLSISVNITAGDLADPNFPARVGVALDRHRLPPEALDLELVEGAALDADAVPLAVLDLLREMGVGLSLDDFGTGYSAFGRLRHLPVRTLKIDRIFVSDADTDENALRIIQAIVSLGHDLNLRVIAEGVETPEQAEALLRCGCKMVQGYHIARPMPAEDFPAWYSSRDGKF